MGNLQSPKSGKRSEAENLKIIEEILKPHPGNILKIVGELRKKISSFFPEWEERGYPVWKAIGFRDPKQGYVCGIFPFSERVQLIFEWGVLFTDPKKKLKGETKQIRYLEYSSLNEIDSELILYYLRQSLELPPGKKEKEFLISDRISKSPPPSKKKSKRKT
ncbi:hypothetical protein ACE5IS_06415 [Leptospira wolffii]|uniref:DUF1801 domain-containing protein n=1 Tax=Leptospira wolffii TaxID=409998 RepID=A0ABV5BKX1_9LEPT